MNLIDSIMKEIIQKYPTASFTYYLSVDVRNVPLEAEEYFANALHEFISTQIPGFKELQKETDNIEIYPSCSTNKIKEFTDIAPPFCHIDAALDVTYTKKEKKD